MLKHLATIGKAFPSCVFLAASLLLCLPAQGAPAAKECNCPCAKDKGNGGASEGQTGQVTIFWPREDNILARAFRSKIEVQVDGATVGAVDPESPLTISVPGGAHKLSLKNRSGYFETKTSDTQIMVSPQKPLYFQILDDNGRNVSASELDAATAQALLSGNGAASGTGTGTIYVYWPKSELDLDFLDKLNADVPVYLGGQRVGALTKGEYLVVKAPSGKHVLSVDMSLSSGEMLKQKLILGAGSTRYFHVEKRLDFRIIEDSPEEAADFTSKGLRQRQASTQ